MNKTIFGALAGVILAFGMTEASYACEWDALAAESDYFYNSGLNHVVHKDTQNGYEYMFLEDSDIPIYGYSIDKNGEIYYTEPNSTTGIAKDTWIKGMYFDNEGKFTYKFRDDIDQLCADFEDGKEIATGNKEETSGFIEYYISDYKILNEEIGCNVNNNGESYLLRSFGNQESKNATKDAIRTVISNVEGCSTKAKVIDAISQMKDIKYDLDYTYTDLQNAIHDRTMVCWHYVKTLKVALEDIGIECETLTTKVGGNFHSILRYKDGDRWVYVDPTADINNGALLPGSMAYIDINNAVMTNQYTLASRVEVTV